MKLEVEGGRLTLGDARVRYNSAYLSEDDFVRLLDYWLSRLRAVDSTADPEFLPFSIDDEFVEAFEAHSTGLEIELRVVKLDNCGYVHGVDPLFESMFGEIVVVETYPEPILTCTIGELIEAIVDWLGRHRRTA
ncbi:MAG: hypothetical protein IPK82_17190 [Polyangiaceae bacterium]|nr:hypothetical protein [Polyangiaceae bacterium]